jgi:enterochelin esterase-like enzyme
VVDSFLAALASCPLIEADTVAHFLYAGQASSVTVAGDMNQWDPRAWPMRNLTGTTLWYRTAVFERDARIDYKFVVDGGTWLLDPRNPYQVRGGFGPNSELRMPGYVPPDEVVYRPEVPHGTLRDTTVTSFFLGNTRTIRVYLPPGYDGGQESLPLLLVHDGLEYISLAQAHVVLDNLIAAQRIRPVVAVFVPPVDRTAEYAGSKKELFTRFLLEELLPALCRRYRIASDPSLRAVLGASNGGNIALYLGLHHPEAFGNVAAQSSNVEPEIAAGFRDGPRLPLRIYLDLGTYDIPLIIERVRGLVPILTERGYPLRCAEYHEGHSWGNWRAHVDEALEFFFPGPALRVGMLEETLPTTPRVQVYPNPMKGSGTLAVHLPRGTSFEIRLYDVRGRCQRTLRSCAGSAGVTTVWLDARDDRGFPLESGLYICRLAAPGGITSVGRLILLR